MTKTERWRWRKRRLPIIARNYALALEHFQKREQELARLTAALERIVAAYSERGENLHEEWCATLWEKPCDCGEDELFAAIGAAR